MEKKKSMDAYLIHCWKAMKAHDMFMSREGSLQIIMTFLLLLAKPPKFPFWFALLILKKWIQDFKKESRRRSTKNYWFWWLLMTLPDEYYTHNVFWETEVLLWEFSCYWNASYMRQVVFCKDAPDWWWLGMGTDTGFIADWALAFSRCWKVFRD